MSKVSHQEVEQWLSNGTFEQGVELLKRLRPQIKVYSYEQVKSKLLFLTGYKAQQNPAGQAPEPLKKKPQTTNHEPRTTNKEPRTKNKEQRTTNKEPRTTNNERSTQSKRSKSS